MRQKESYIRRQERRLSEGRIDRRRFVMSALATGVTLPTATSLANRAEAMVPRKGGHLRYGTSAGSSDDLLSPLRAENHMMASVAFAAGACLTEIDADGDLIGAIAEHFEARDGNRTWAFDLRPEVTFQNGRVLVAEDVVATLARHLDTANRSRARGLLRDVKGVFAENAGRVVIELDHPDPEFPYMLSDFRLAILPDGIFDPLAGAGAYRIEAFEPGKRALLTRNEGHWRHDRGHFDAVEFLSVPDAARRQVAVMTGEVDFVDDVDPRTVALLRNAPGIAICETRGNRHYAFPMPVNRAPFDSGKLRQALKLAVNREELVEKVLLGHGTAGNDLPVRDDSFSQRRYDPDEAARLFRAAHIDGPIRLSVEPGVFPGAHETAQLIAASARQAGIPIKVESGKMGAGWRASAWSGRPTDNWMFAAAYEPGGDFDETCWQQSPAGRQFGEFCRTARNAPDASDRLRARNHARRLLRDEGGLMVPMWANDIHAHSDRLAHPAAIGTNWRADGGKLAERWWFS